MTDQPANSSTASESPQSERYTLSQSPEVPKRTTPTWEMELLLSGALVFSMVQLPALLDTLLMRLMPTFSLGVSTALIIVGLYLRAGLFALCFAFIAHLAVRAYWVALIGVNSVFPGKPDWSKSWASSIGKRVADETWVPMEHRIEAADNVASVVFAIGIACVIMMLSLSVVISVMIAFGMGLTAISGGRISSFAGFLIGCTLPLAIALIGPTIDQMAGKKIAPDSLVARIITKSYVWQMNSPGFAHVGAITNPIFLNVKLKTFSKALIGLALLTVLIASMISSVQNGKNQARFENFLPTNAAVDTLRPEYYRNQRKGAVRYSANATVESVELGDRALLLFVPLIVDRHLHRMESDCPELAAIPKSQRGSQAHLQCAANLLAPRLDGKPIPTMGLTWMLDPHSGFEGLAWRIDNSLIARGKHTIQVKTFARKDGRVPPEQVITFYR